MAEDMAAYSPSNCPSRAHRPPTSRYGSRNAPRIAFGDTWRPRCLSLTSRVIETESRCLGFDLCHRQIKLSNVVPACSHIKFCSLKTTGSRFSRPNQYAIVPVPSNRYRKPHPRARHCVFLRAPHNGTLQRSDWH